MEVKKDTYSNTKSMIANKIINNKSTSQLNTKDYFFDYKAKEPYEKINQALTNKKQDNSNKKYLRRERHFKSKVQRAFYLGDIDEENIKANFNNGVLKVTVPKKQIESNKKLIDIE